MVQYEVHLNENKVYECGNRDEAHDYINAEHNEIMPFLEYEPYGDGSLEVWSNTLMNIKVIRIKKGKVDIHRLLEEHKNRDERERVIEEVNVEKTTPLTPKRTQMKDNKKLIKAGEGKTKKDKDGNTWISKKNKKGEYKWTRYYEENYENSNSKRKCPKNPAKTYEEGTVKKGLDGKMWQVKLLGSGKKKWYRK